MVVVVVAVTAPRSASPTTMFYLFLGRVRDERKKRRKEKRREEKKDVVFDAVIFLPAFYPSVVSREFFAPFRLSPAGREEGFYDLLMETGFNRRL